MRDKISQNALSKIRFMPDVFCKTLTILTCCTASLSFVVSPSNAFVLPDTGQSKCYAPVTPHAEINCSDTGQDGMYSSNTLSYTPNNNGTVTDNNTNLMWQQQDGGLKNWATAVSYCTDLELAGFTDWRLPSKKELLSLVDYGINTSAAKINNGYFPGTNAYIYWTSTPEQGSSGTYWYVTFSDGGSGTTFQSQNTYNVRCVRGEQYTQNLTNNYNGTITDSGTGLIWQQEDPGEMTWGDALAYCNNLVLPANNGYSDWRLPNIKELDSLSLETRKNPSLNFTFFPGYHSYGYWSSTSYAVPDTSGYNPKAWNVEFNWGRVSRETNKTYPLNVRCVRGGGLITCPATAVTINGAGTPFTHIYDAYSNAINNDVLYIQAMAFPEDLSLTGNFSITLKGGYECNFASNPGFSTVNGQVTISTGTVILDNIIISD